MSRDDDIEAWIEAGVYDPSAPGADDRLELLRFYKQRGVPLDLTARLNAEGHINRAGADHVLHVERSLTAAQIGPMCGLSPDEIDRVWLALGHPAVPQGSLGFSEADVPVLVAFAFSKELFGIDAALQFTRVMGSSMARMADAAMSTFGVNVEEPMTAHGGRDVDIARIGIEALEGLVMLPQMLTQLFHRHVEGSVERTRARDSLTADVFSHAVGFVDLVGYTAWSQELAMSDLGAAMSAFEESASLRAGTGGARIVKTIGDAVMFVAPDAGDACRVALDIVDDVDRHPVLTSARGSVAYGTLLGRDGDYFGPAVNLAARAIKVAEPGTIVADHAVAGLKSQPLGSHDLRGIAGPVDLFVVSR